MNEVGDPSASAGAVARGSVARVGSATALTAICVYAVIYLAARNMPPASFSVFGVFWGALGVATGAANGLQVTTREIRMTRYSGISADRCTHPLRVAWMIGSVAAIVIAGTSPLWSRQIFAEPRELSVWLLSAGLAGFCLQAALLGALAGANGWTGTGR